MTRQHVSRTNQQSKSDTPLVSGVLQRAAVRTVPEKDVEPIEEVESTTFRESRFHHNFIQMPVYTDEMPRIQPKLKIGAVGDRYEQEADRVAQDVVQRINAPAPERGNEDEVRRKTQEGTLQREEMPEDEEELRMKPMVQRLSAEGGMAAPPDLDSSIQRARGGGQPLGDEIREPMERAFGADFTGVKVHADATSDQLNQSIQAKAFTTGQDVFFRQGAYQPGNRGGQELIAHELTHVVQQNGGAVQRNDQARKEECPQTPQRSAQRGYHRGHPAEVRRQLDGELEKVTMQQFKNYLTPYNKNITYSQAKALYEEVKKENKTFKHIEEVVLWKWPKESFAADANQVLTGKLNQPSEEDEKTKYGLTDDPPQAYPENQRGTYYRGDGRKESELAGYGGFTSRNLNLATARAEVIRWFQHGSDPEAEHQAWVSNKLTTTGKSLIAMGKDTGCAGYGVGTGRWVYQAIIPGLRLVTPDLTSLGVGPAQDTSGANLLLDATTVAGATMIAVEGVGSRKEETTFFTAIPKNHIKCIYKGREKGIPASMQGYYPHPKDI